MAKALGTTDDITTCDCCGKEDLKLTVVIELDGGEIVHYGRICASRNTGKAPKVINAEIKAEALRKLLAAQAEWEKHPAYIAERARFDARPRGLPGMAAIEFIREAREIADAARAELAGRHQVPVWRLV